MLSKHELKNLTKNMPNVLDDEDERILNLIGFEYVILPRGFQGNWKYRWLMMLGFIQAELNVSGYIIYLSKEGLAAIGKYRN